MTNLLPCPFCGGEAEKDIVHDLGVHAGKILCGKCGARTAAYFIGKDEGAEFVVIEAWNKRAERTCKPTKNKHGFLNCCSECGRSLIETAVSLYNYCPNCGARVRSEA